MNAAIVVIPSDLSKGGLQAHSNGVHPIVILNSLHIISKHYAKELVQMAIKAVGTDPKKQEEWIDQQTKLRMPGGEDIDGLLSKIFS